MCVSGSRPRTDSCAFFLNSSSSSKRRFEASHKVHACIRACMHQGMHLCITMHPCIHASLFYCHASMHPCIHASMHPCIHASMPIHPSIHPSVRPNRYIRPSIRPSVCPSPSVHLSVCPSVRLCVYADIYRSTSMDRSIDNVIAIRYDYNVILCACIL